MHTCAISIHVCVYIHTCQAWDDALNRKTRPAVHSCAHAPWNTEEFMHMYIHTSASNIQPCMHTFCRLGMKSWIENRGLPCGMTITGMYHTYMTYMYECVQKHAFDAVCECNKCNTWHALAHMHKYMHAKWLKISWFFWPCTVANWYLKYAYSIRKYSCTHAAGEQGSRMMAQIPMPIAPHKYRGAGGQHGCHTYLCMQTYTHICMHSFTLCRGAGDTDDGIGGAEDSQSEGERMRTNVYLPTELM